MSIFTKAAAYALQDQPVVNATVPFHGPKGLVVPVMRNVESINYADIEINLPNLGKKTKKESIAVEDMDGGTFTISNVNAWNL
uniref:Dihydrolipoyllysine-residue succinyltransferase component of 2-oxoglutarate dehydrogenase complex, mitochondrial n=1 Tax=Megaselia scalaris TaxID=36166 RepID=T1GG99_MEGSC